jgi:hypothetical protein
MSVSLVISYFIPFLILDKLYRVIQKERNILGGGSIGHKEKKKRWYEYVSNCASLLQ